MNEIIIGLVSPIGTEKDIIVKTLEKNIEAYDSECKVTTIFGDIIKIQEEIYDRQLIDLRDKYVKSIESDNINLLINKDMNENSIKVDSGQEIYKIYHESHYFINTDSSKAFIKNSVLKFIKLLYGHYDEYPDTDEFGMAIAYASAMRSNYPTNRQVGASILTQGGETLALGSIRVPNQDATTSKMEAEKVRYKFEETKEKLGKYKEYIEKSNIEDSSKKEISDFLMDSLDYHPCTHAEISAIADAAKLGIAIKEATLYTTTYPCHLCLRDIITSGIKRIVYLEHYPKSKVEYIFEDLLDHHKWEIEAFEGVGPKRFAYVYNSRFLKSDSDKKFIISQRTFDYYKSAEEKELKFLLHTLAKTFPH